jgi:ribosomal protein L29
MEDTPTEARLQALEAVLPTLASKADIADLRGELKTDISELRGELKSDISELRGELKTDISELRGELKTEIGELRGELKTEIGELRGELKTGLAELRGELSSGLANMRTSGADNRSNIDRWMMATVIGLFIGFGGLFLAMNNALKPGVMAAAQQPIIINVPSPAAAPGR